MKAPSTIALSRHLIVGILVLILTSCHGSTGSDMDAATLRDAVAATEHASGVRVTTKINGFQGVVEFRWPDYYVEKDASGNVRTLVVGDDVFFGAPNHPGSFAKLTRTDAAMGAISMIIGPFLEPDDVTRTSEIFDVTLEGGHASATLSQGRLATVHLAYEGTDPVDYAFEYAPVHLLHAPRPDQINGQDAQCGPSNLPSHGQTVCVMASASP